MRIAHVADSYPPDLGGIQVVVRELAHEAVLHGHDVEVFAHAGRHSRPGTEVRDGTLIHRFMQPVPSEQFAFSPGLFAALARNRRQFDVVHAHNFHALPALASAFAGMRPIVFTPYYHGGGHSRAARVAHRAYRPFSRLIFASCARVVCVSRSEAAKLVTDLPHVASLVSVVPIGVAADAFARASPFDLPGKVIVAAGRMEPYKQFHRIALAAEFLQPDAQLVLLGEGTERSRIERLAAHPELASRIQLKGRVSDGDLRRWFRTAATVVSMSLYESFGLTLVEALAAGSPVVASDIPAHRETAFAQPEGAVRLLPTNASPRQIASIITSAGRNGLPSGVRIRTWGDVGRDFLEIYASVARR